MAAFRPKFTITPLIARGLMQIEAAKEAVETLPITPRVLANLRETARLFSTHYSTAIEGNRLTQEQVVQTIGERQHFPGRERDQDEVLGYYAALDEVQRLAERGAALTGLTIRKLHGLVMGGGKNRVKPTAYRDGQNVIRDSRSRGIVYMPPEASDVPALMEQLTGWLNLKDDLPVPLKAAIAHYRFATVHPYYDGNGRTARLLTTLILHLGGYGLKGLYALEEYYARDLKAYYKALAIGSSHNYYLGRADADITAWVAYFIEGTATSFGRVRQQAQHEAETGIATAQAPPNWLRTLDAKQKKALTLFERSRDVTAKDIAALFGFQQRTAAALCQHWVSDGFLSIVDPARKSRRYRLSSQYEAWITNPPARRPWV